jgi:hypothetical protein
VRSYSRYPSQAESFDKDMDLYAKEHDKKHLDRQEPYLQSELIKIYPGEAIAKIKGEIEKTETQLAESVANSVLDEVLYDLPSPEKAPSEPPWGPVPRRKPPTPDGMEERIRAVQAIIEHSSGAKIEGDMLRGLLEKIFEAMRSSDEIATLQNGYTLRDVVRDAVLEHWSTDRSFFAAGHRLNSGFLDVFWLHNLLLLRLKLAESQPPEGTGLAPHITAILKLLGREPAYFYEADSGSRDGWKAEAKQRYDRTQASNLEAGWNREQIEKLAQISIQTDKIPQLAKVLKDSAPALDTGKRTLTGLERGRESRWGPHGEKIKMMKQYLDKKREDYPQVEFSTSGLIHEIIKDCHVSESTIRRALKNGELTIPSKKAK